MQVRVSRRVVFYWRDDQLICDDPVRHRRLALTPDAERLLRTFAGWTPIDAADDVLTGGTQLAKQLYDAGVLVSEDDDVDAAWHTMGELATAYHLSTRALDDAVFRTPEEDVRLLREKALREPLPSPYKDYPGESVPLPAEESLPAPIAELMNARRSTRDFDTTRAISTTDLAALLRWSAGSRHEIDIPGIGTILLKAVPSGGARHPVEVYPVVRRVDGIEPGIYHYSTRRHALEPLPAGGPGEIDDGEVLHWCGDQPWAADAAVLFLYTAIVERATWKYPTANTYRTVFLDAGHISQNCYLVATALGLGAFFTVATRDAAIERALGLDWSSEMFVGLTGIGVMTDAERARQAAMLTGGPVHTSRRGGRRS
jgi:SagB-type dehydrogenase family enzyme